MKIDFKRFENDLQKYKVSESEISISSSGGISKVIQYVWNQSRTSNIDFSAFTLSDTYSAFRELYSLPHFDDDVSNSEILAMKNNKWEINAIAGEVIAGMVSFNNKVFEDDDEDFI